MAEKKNPLQGNVTFTPKPENSNWQNFWASVGSQFGGQNATGASGKSFEGRPFGYLSDVVNWLNAPTGATPGAKPAVAPQVSAMTFNVGQAAAQPATPSASDPAGIFSSLVGVPVKLTSGKRSAAHNAAVGGSPTSSHVTGEAYDFVPQGITTKEAVARMVAQGFSADQIIDEGNHVHVGFGAKNRGQVLTKTGNGFQQFQAEAGGNPFQAPPVTFLDPAAAAGMISAPTMVPKVAFGAAPQRELPGAPPQVEGLDRNAIIQAMTQASALTPRDTSQDKWNGVKAMLEGAALSAAGADPQAGLGQFLLLAGGGGLRGNRQFSQQIEAKNLAETEQQRQLRIMLAQLGIDIDKTNLGVRNENADRAFKGAEAVKDVKFQNETGTWQNKMNELMTNLGITQTNVGARNAANARRDAAVIGATGNAAEAVNQGNAMQNQLDRAAYTDVGGGVAQERSVAKLLQTAGVPLKEEGKPQPIIANARTTASYIAAGNVDGALGGLANEMVLSGKYADILKPVKGESASSAAAKKDLLTAVKKASADGKNSEAAAAVLATFFTQNPGIGLEVAKAYPSLPSAKMIATHATVK